MEHQVKSDGTAQHFRQIAGADRQLAHQPVRPARPGGIPVAAALSEILAGYDTQSGGNDLHENGHQAGESNDPQQAVFELSPGLQVRAPVAGVHVANTDENGRPDESAPLLPEPGLVVGYDDGAVDSLQRHMSAVSGIRSTQRFVSRRALARL